MGFLRGRHYLAISAALLFMLIFFSAFSGAALVLNSRTGSIDFNTSSTIKMRLASDGNLGINATTPNRTLHVVGDANITGKLILSAGTQLCSGTDANCFYPNAGGTSSNTTDTNTVTANWTNNEGEFTIDLNGLAAINTNTLRSLDNNTLTLQTQNTTRMLITADGNIGINSTTAGYALDVNGNIKIPQTTGDWNGGIIFMGSNRFLHAYGPAGSTFLGIGAGNFTLTPAGGGTGIGYQALSSLTTGVSNTAVGYQAGMDVNSGTQNTFVGYQSGFDVNSGSQNTAIGYRTMLAPQTAGQNTAIGASCMGGDDRITGAGNVCVGYLGMSKLGSGVNNIAIGNSALSANAAGSGNIGIGSTALQDVNGSANNVGIGTSAAADINTGAENVAIGASALRLGTISNYNVAIGGSALAAFNSTTATTGNTAIGYKNLTAVTTGISNIGLGYQAGDALLTGSNNIIIGYDIDLPSTSSANMLNIGNIIYGTGISASGTTVETDANIGIGTATPTSTLQITGDLNVSRKISFGGVYFTGPTTDGAASTCLQTNGTGTLSFGSCGGGSDTNTVTANWTNNEGEFTIDLNGLAAINTNTLRSLDNNTLTLQTQNTTRVTIGTDGNIAIGNTTPTSLFQVAAPANINANALTVNAGTGFVGIGKTNPTTALDVNGALTTTGTINPGANSLFQISLQVAGINTFPGTGAGNNGILGGNTGYTLLTGGTNTIGTANTSIVRHLVVGATTTEATSGHHPLIANAAVLKPRIVSGAATVGNTAALYVEDENNSTTVNGGNYSFWVDAGKSRLDGNVMIGWSGDANTENATVPSALLDVNGTSRFQNDVNITSQSGGGSGFSFESDTNRMCFPSNCTGGYIDANADTVIIGWN